MPAGVGFAVDQLFRSRVFRRVRGLNAADSQSLALRYRRGLALSLRKQIPDTAVICFEQDGARRGRNQRGLGAVRVARRFDERRDRADLADRVERCRVTVFQRNAERVIVSREVATKAVTRATARRVIRRCKSAAPSAPSEGMSRVFERPGCGRRVNRMSESVGETGIGISA